MKGAPAQTAAADPIEAADSALPRLLYLSEVPVESSYHGSALIHRLLSTYPADRLLIVEIDHLSQPDRRLAGVRYEYVQSGLRRMRNRYLAKWRTAALLLKGRWSLAEARCRRLAETFGPQAVLTVSHGTGWLQAVQLAAAAETPLHLICHDDWFGNTHPPAILRRLTEEIFARAYVSSASRMCVSPQMAEDYARRYGRPAAVLYPARSVDAPLYDAPPAGLGGPTRPFTVAFAGSLHTNLQPGCAMLARALAQIGGRLLIFGPTDETASRLAGVTGGHVEYRGLLRSEDLIKAMRAEAHALFVPLSFEAQFVDDVRFSFPSKLTDYTACGLPILMQAPSYSAAMAWARQHPGVAEIIEEDGPEALLAAVGRLSTDGARRERLGAEALRVGRSCFSADHAESVLRACLSSSGAGSDAT
jgi:glycosyltransferase involved in cell wall biosynthesis